jgi:LPXTG-site transpeptidase (sortase) family protein
MKIKNWSKIIIIVFFAGILGAGAYFILIPKLTNNTVNDTLGWKFPVAKFPSTGSVQLASSDIRDASSTPKGLPVRLKIPAISVDSAIEDAFINSDGRMDVPAGSVNVAWFALGPYPGKEGSAVIGGHFGIKNGVPFVFYNLDHLKIGDKVYIVDDRGATITFIVRSISSFDRNADATDVFTSSDGLAHLNLVTCEGTWNKVNNSYPQRLVVFTDAISSKQ